jgi:hypothetical protein
MPIPVVLTDPPWRKPRSAPSGARADAPATKAPAKPATMAPSLVWEEGERESFRGKPPPHMTEVAEERLKERLLDELDKRAPLRAGEVARLGDESLAELAGELDGSTTDAATLKIVLGRVGDDILENAIAIVRAAPPERLLFEAAMPVRAAELARTAASAFHDRAIPMSAEEPHTRTAVEAWMLRHADAVTAGLHGDESAPALAALAFVAAHGAAMPGEGYACFAGMSAVRNPWALLLATRDDPRALSLLADDPAAAAWVAHAKAERAEKELSAVPEGVAELPAFFDPKVLSAPRADGAPLPEDAVLALGEMLRFSPLANPYAGIEQVRAACDARSLDDFAFDLFERWREAGEEPRDLWALESSGKIGGERCARAVAERIRSWARGATAPRYAWSSEAHQMVQVEMGSRGFMLARAGCAVLAAMTGESQEVAHNLLGDLARAGVQVWLRREAARALGIAEDASQDDVEGPVPDVGLDADGTATLDLGTRKLFVRIDEHVTPALFDAEGARVASFPRARKDDDAQKHKTAKERWSAIDKDAKIVVRYQLALLERMMVSQRTFEPAAFRERYITHTFLRHLGRRVVWIANRVEFRIAEDGSFADVNDHAVDAGDLSEHPIGVAHPVLMHDRAAWKTRFFDYEILQPFEQIDRATFVRGNDDIGEREIKRAVSMKTSRGRLFQLGRRGWKARFEPDSTHYERELPSGALGRFEVRPAVTEGDDKELSIAAASCTYAFDRLPPIDFSELMRDVAYATEKG